MEKNSYSQLRAKIKDKTATLCVMGLGYVGLPLVQAFAQKGFFVYGFDPNHNRIKKLQKGERYIVDIDPNVMKALINRKKFFPTTDESVLAKADVIIICVPTPLRKVKIPDISYVVAAAQTIQKNLRKQQLIVLESTSFPTTTREILLPKLKKTGLIEEKDFFLCFSPERVNPGDKKYPFVKIPKLVGGLSPKSSQLAKQLYSHVLKKVSIVSSPEVAETSKLLENTFRLVNIALANEFAIVCNKLGISIWEVIEAAKTKPFGFMPFYPGPGCGGHCIPCDPVYLSWKAKKLGFKTKMIDLASYIDHFMPHYVVGQAEELLKVRKKPLASAKVLVLGVTYKKDVKDLRESAALDIIEDLAKRKAHVDYYDPLVPFLKINGIDMQSIRLSAYTLKQYDCVIIVTAHSKVNYSLIQKNASLIYDTRNVYKKKYDNVITL